MLTPEPTVSELEQLKKVAEAYIAVDDALTDLRRQTKEYNTRKKTLNEFILEFMRKYNHEELYLGNGHYIHYKKNKVMEPLSQKEIQRRMESMHLSDDVRKSIFMRNKIDKDCIKNQKKSTNILAL